MTNRIRLIISILILIPSSVVLIYFERRSPFGFTFWAPVCLLIGSVLVVLGLLSFYATRSSNKKWLRITGFVGISACSIILISLLLVVNKREWIPGINKSLSQEQWRQDINQLTNLIQIKFPGYHTMDTTNFLAHANQLKNEMPNQGWQRKAELFKLIALLKDGHSSILPFQVSLDFHFYPLNVYQFEEGVFIVDADDRVSEFVGSEIVKIENVPIQEVLKRMEKYYGGDNGQFRKAWFPVYGMIAELLANEGIAHQRDRITITCQLPQGDLREFEVKAQPFPTWGLWYLGFLRSPEADSTHVRLSVRRENYLIRFLEKEDLLHVQLNQLINTQTKTINELSREIDRIATENTVDKLVIDLRNNLGGNNYLARNLVKSIQKNSTLNKQGHLFVLTSRKTYSAAVNLCSVFENMTEAIFIGEPPGAGANHFGDPVEYVLSNSNIQIQLSSKQWLGTMPDDTSTLIIPHILIPDTYHAFSKHEDSSMKAVINYSHESSSIQYVDTTWAGRFQLNAYQLVTVDVMDANATMEISDGSGSSLFEVLSPLVPINPNELATRFHNVHLQRRNDSVFLNWKNKVYPLIPTPENVQLPMHWIAKGETKEVRKLINQDLSNLPPDAESIINTIGYKFLANNELQRAINVFVLNSQLFPTSANAFDSLGEGYVALGEKEKAIESFKTALKLNPRLITSRQSLETLVR